MKLRKGFNLIPGLPEEGIRMSEKIAYVSIHVRIMSEQYDWLRQYSYENRVPQAEVIRKALEMYRQEKRIIRDGIVC